MLRRLFTLLSALSLLLCLAVAVLWVRSYWRSDVLQFPDRLHVVMTSPGAFWVTTASRPYWDGTPWHQSDVADPTFHRSFGRTFAYTVRPAPGGASHAALGFVYLAYVQASPPPPCRFTYLAVPLWVPLLVSLVMPTIWLRRARARARVRLPASAPRATTTSAPPRAAALSAGLTPRPSAKTSTGAGSGCRRPSACPHSTAGASD
jgi:hypothetical protein